MKVLLIILYMAMFLPSKEVRSDYDCLTDMAGFQVDVGIPCESPALPTPTTLTPAIIATPPELTDGQVRHYWADSKWRLCEACYIYTSYSETPTQYPQPRLRPRIRLPVA